jgi:hypothetical protein
MEEKGTPVPNTKNTWQVTSVASLQKSPAFKADFELRYIIASIPEASARGLSQALLEYIRGRPAGFHDEPFIAQ